MATYFPNSNNQRDASTVLYLREPVENSYSETPVLPGNAMMFVNYSSSESYSDTLAVPIQQNNIPQVGVSDSNLSQQENLSNLGGMRFLDHGLHGWKDGRNDMLMHSMDGTDVLQVAKNLQNQALSLSLGSHFEMPSIQFQNPSQGFAFLRQNPSASGQDTSTNISFSENENSQDKQSRNLEYVSPGFPGCNFDSVSMYGLSGLGRAFPNTKYLKAAQELLDEVVDVRKALKENNPRKEFKNESKEGVESKNQVLDNHASGSSPNQHESSSNSACQLSAAEKQDLQNKLTKLLSILDEVDRRYKQYYHQMQIVASSFDAIAGSGASKPYTALALQTISRHFRCLRDAIDGQIRVARESLGEQDSSGSSKGIGISRLRFVDQQLRQQRALHQLGMMQQHTWRPQRGLPESSVSILRAWLFEHFLHPYPKDSEKIMLARQTGLTRSQVSNWFINARVRLWKPMVEEMYKEELGDAEMDSNSSSEMASRATKSDAKASEDKRDDLQQSASSAATEHFTTSEMFELKDNNVHNIEMAGPETGPSFQTGKPSSYQKAMLGDTRFLDAMVQTNGDNDRFLAAAAAYHMSELNRFGNGGGVSLTLGLQHCEGSSVPMSIENHQSFVSIRGDNAYDASASLGTSTTDFDFMDSGNRQHEYGSSHHLHDFVA